MTCKDVLIETLVLVAIAGAFTALLIPLAWVSIERNSESPVTVTAPPVTITTTRPTITITPTITVYKDAE